MSRVAAASASRCAATRRARVAVDSRGASPGTTTTSPSSSSSGKAVSATITASPVPRWTCCSTKSIASAGGPWSISFFVTRSAPWPTTTTARSTSRPATASRMCRSMARPHRRCSGLGRSERMRVPDPAASTTATSGAPSWWVLLMGCSYHPRPAPGQCIPETAFGGWRPHAVPRADLRRWSVVPYRGSRRGRGVPRSS